MKSIILAAGLGTRLGSYTKDIPKGMLKFSGKSLIQWQVDTIKKVGINDIIIITGYKKETVDIKGVQYCHNKNYASTNMIESLMCAKDFFNDDILVSYSDILYEDKILRKLLESQSEVAVLVDKEWRKYWKMRYGTSEKDLETLQVTSDRKIIEIGKPTQYSRGIDYRYIGLIKFSKNGIKNAQDVYQRKKNQGGLWQQSGKPFLKGYMTDLLNELIINDYEVKAVICQNGWLEFDLESDLKTVEKAIKEGSLSEIINLNK